jgi:hypothetical protein
MFPNLARIRGLGQMVRSRENASTQGGFVLPVDLAAHITALGVDVYATGYSKRTRTAPSDTSHRIAADGSLSDLDCEVAGRHLSVPTDDGLT